jgi:hypothetical protein
MADRRAANAEITRAWAANSNLASRFNLLLTVASTYHDDCTRRFADLNRRISELEQENAVLRAAVAKERSEWNRYAGKLEREIAQLELDKIKLRAPSSDKPTIRT